jgi:hypothetical protein
VGGSVEVAVPSLGDAIVRYILELEKRVPIALDVDVVVAGTGISGVTAA